MPVGIRKNAWNAGNESQRWAMRLAGSVCELGEPAVYVGGGQDWFIFDDTRISLRDVAILGTVAAGLAQYPNWTVPTRPNGSVDRVKAREQIETFVRNSIVLPRDIAYTEIVQEQVPEYVWVEVPVLDENGDPVLDENGNPVTQQVREATGGTVLVDVERPLGDPYGLTLAAQGAPGWIAAASAIPAGWTVKVVG